MDVYEILSLLFLGGTFLVALCPQLVGRAYRNNKRKSLSMPKTILPPERFGLMVPIAAGRQLEKPLVFLALRLSPHVSDTEKDGW